jgi:hypothetical protein
MDDTGKRPYRRKPRVWGETQTRTIINVPSSIRKLADAACKEHGYSLSEYFRRAGIVYALTADPSGSGIAETLTEADKRVTQIANGITARYEDLSYDEALALTIAFRDAKESQTAFAALADREAKDAKGGSV